MDRDAIFCPYRVVSDDGYCAVDVTVADGEGDVSNGLAIARSAEQLMQQCVASGRDGFMRGFSKQTSVISSYEASVHSYPYLTKPHWSNLNLS